MNQRITTTHTLPSYTRSYAFFTPLSGVLFFVVGVILLADGLRILPPETQGILQQVVANPFTALFVGMLATSVIQNSTLSISLLVVMVGANVFDIREALPIVLGVNVGTIITITINELGATTNRHLFLRAISVVLLQDLFNFFTALLVFPIEYYFHLFEYLSSSLTQLGTEQYQVFSFDFSLYTSTLCEQSTLSAILVTLGFLLMVVSLRLYSQYHFKKYIGKKRTGLTKALQGKDFQTLLDGTAYTLALQSSARVTALLISRIHLVSFSFKKVFLFVIGTNLGTTCIAFLVAAFLPPPALVIALAHLGFNLVGALLFAYSPFFRNLPITVAAWLSKMILKERLFGFAYIFILFFLIPFLLILLGR